MIRPHADDAFARPTGRPDAVARLAGQVAGRARVAAACGRRAATRARRVADALAVLALLAGALLAWLAPAAPAGAAAGPGRAPAPSPPHAATAYSFVPGGRAPAVAAQPLQQPPLPVPTFPLIGPLNPGPIKDLVLTLLRDGLIALNETLRAPLRAFLDSPLNVVSQTPAAGSYANPVVTDLHATVRRAALALLLLVGVLGGINVIVKDRIGAAYHEGAEVLARLPFGAALASASLALVELPIAANNALCALVGDTALSGLTSVGAGTQAFAGLVAALLYLVAGICLLLQMLLRLALVDVLIVIAPLALIAWILPQTEGLARWWTRTFLGAVFVQFLQVVALRLGTGLFVDVTPVGDVGAAILPSLLGVAVLILTMRIPELVRAGAGGGLGLTRFVVYTKLAGALRGR